MIGEITEISWFLYNWFKMVLILVQILKQNIFKKNSFDFRMKNVVSTLAIGFCFFNLKKKSANRIGQNSLKKGKVSFLSVSSNKTYGKLNE